MLSDQELDDIRERQRRWRQALREGLPSYNDVAVLLEALTEARAEIERLTEHSKTLNLVSRMLAEVLGEWPAGANECVVNPVELTTWAVEAVAATSGNGFERFCISSRLAVSGIPGDRCLEHGAQAAPCLTSLRPARCKHLNLSPNHSIPHCSECGKDVEVGGVLANPLPVVGEQGCTLDVPVPEPEKDRAAFGWGRSLIQRDESGNPIWICGRCGARDGIHILPHLSNYCQITQSVAPIHHCCPGDCTLDAAPTDDAQGNGGAA